MNFKLKLLTLTVLVPNLGFAHLMKLEEFDQFKLGELLENLPASVRFISRTSIYSPVPGVMIKSVFPKYAAPFSITCWSKYFSTSPYPSYTKCDVNIDVNHPALDARYDQYKFTFTSSDMVSSLRHAIPYTNHRKQYNSFNRDRGTTYEGKFTNIFHYIFTCLPGSCILKLSSKI